MGRVKLGRLNVVTIASSLHTHEHKTTAVEVTKTRASSEGTIRLYRCCCTAVVPPPLL